MPWPQYSRTPEKRWPSAYSWIAWPMSPSVAPGFTARMPRNIASRVVSTSRRAITEGLPT